MALSWCKATNIFAGIMGRVCQTPDNKQTFQSCCHAHHPRQLLGGAVRIAQTPTEALQATFEGELLRCIASVDNHR